MLLYKKKKGQLFVVLKWKNPTALGHIFLWTATSNDAKEKLDIFPASLDAWGQNLVV